MRCHPPDVSAVCEPFRPALRVERVRWIIRRWRERTAETRCGPRRPAPDRAARGADGAVPVAPAPSPCRAAARYGPRISPWVNPAKNAELDRVLLGRQRMQRRVQPARVCRGGNRGGDVVFCRRVALLRATIRVAAAAPGVARATGEIAALRTMVSSQARSDPRAGWKEAAPRQTLRKASWTVSSAAWGSARGCRRPRRRSGDRAGRAHPGRGIARRDHAQQRRAIHLIFVAAPVRTGGLPHAGGVAASGRRIPIDSNGAAGSIHRLPEARPRTPARARAGSPQWRLLH